MPSFKHQCSNVREHDRQAREGGATNEARRGARRGLRRGGICAGRGSARPVLGTAFHTKEASSGDQLCAGGHFHHRERLPWGRPACLPFCFLLSRGGVPIPCCNGGEDRQTLTCRQWLGHIGGNQKLAPLKLCSSSSESLSVDCSVCCGGSAAAGTHGGEGAGGNLRGSGVGYLWSCHEDSCGHIHHHLRLWSQHSLPGCHW